MRKIGDSHTLFKLMQFLHSYADEHEHTTRMITIPPRIFVSEVADWMKENNKKHVYKMVAGCIMHLSYAAA